MYQSALATTTDLLADVALAHDGVRKPKVSAKAVGQFFTPPPVARFIASLISEAPERCRLLDPGAGAGVLSAAMCEHLSRKGVRELEVHAYETDRAALMELDATLASCKAAMQAKGRHFASHVHAVDFVLEGPLAEDGLFGSGGEGFDFVVMNPPYQKIGRESRYVLAPGIDASHPNLYALFMSIGARLTSPGGQMLAIVPRSFANGPYFAAFRRSFFAEMSLERVHVFNSRRSAFADAGVLQENVILHARRRRPRRTTIKLSSSEGPGAPVTVRALPHRIALGGPDSEPSVLRLPTTDREVEVLKLVDRWPALFCDLPLRISTGPVVAFRAERFLTEPTLSPGRIPLYTVQSVRRFVTEWPGPSLGKARSFMVNDASRRLLVSPANMVLLRRFSAKEERTRLTASPLYKESTSAEGFAIENHVNYVVHTRRELTQSEVAGLLALFNSTLLDVYFRSTSGNTQVNAADIRSMPFPPMEMIGRLGQVLENVEGRDDDERERAILTALGIAASMQDLILG